MATTKENEDLLKQIEDLKKMNDRLTEKLVDSEAEKKSGGKVYKVGKGRYLVKGNFIANGQLYNESALLADPSILPGLEAGGSEMIVKL